MDNALFKTLCISEHIVYIKTVLLCDIYEVHKFLYFMRKEFILFIADGLQAKLQRPVERKYIKVTDLWPKNTPNHIPRNYRELRMPKEEALPIYCGDLSAIHIEICSR